MRISTAHPTDEGLEQFALGRLAEADVAPLEKHLLICSACQDKLLELDEYVEAMRIALTELEAESQPAWQGLLRKIFQLPEILKPTRTAAVVALAALLVIMLPVWQAGEDPHDLRLEAYRGAEQPLMATAPAGQPLRLSVDLTGLAPGPVYVVEIVDSSGRSVWEAPVQGSSDVAIAEPGRALAAGQYWTRVYEQVASGQRRGELLREFGLRIE